MIAQCSLTAPYASSSLVPEDFAHEFVTGGWRRVERLYGARTTVINKWIEACGGDTLRAMRPAARNRPGMRKHCEKVAG